MSWLLRNNWLWSLLAFVLGAAITWALIDRRDPAVAVEGAAGKRGEEKEDAVVGARTTDAETRGARATRRPPVARDTSRSAPTAREGSRPASVVPRASDPSAAVPEEAEPATVDSAADPATVEREEAEPATVVPADAEAAAVVSEEGRPAAGSEGSGPVFSQLMDTAPTLFDQMSLEAPEVPTVVPPGRYGEGSADAVPHQGPPDGFIIKGNAQSMLFHTPDSPYYGRTKPQVWFRTEADAERAGFTKYTRRPRKSTNPDPRD